MLDKYQTPAGLYVNHMLGITQNVLDISSFNHVLITAGTRIITCVSRVLHVFTTCATRDCPRAKILSSSKLFAASDAVPIFPRVLPRQ